jgi:long-chain acyl-CoA synthetase
MLAFPSARALGVSVVTITATPDRADRARDPSGAEPRTLFELFRKSSTVNPEGVAFRHKRDGWWIDVTWRAHARDVAGIAKGLLASGVTTGDRVAILSGSRLEWVQCDSAIVNIGAVTVGIYQSNLAPDCAYILDHAEASVIFVENDEQLQKVLSVRDELPRLRHVVVFDGPGKPSTGVSAWADLIAAGEQVEDERLEQAGRGIAPDDLASLVYTRTWCSWPRRPPRRCTSSPTSRRCCSCPWPTCSHG